MKYVQHKIVSGDRIDKVSKRYYGRVDNAEPIFRQNPQLKFSAFLEDHVGTVIIIPVDDSAQNFDLVKPGIRGVE